MATWADVSKQGGEKLVEYFAGQEFDPGFTQESLKQWALGLGWGDSKQGGLAYLEAGRKGKAFSQRDAMYATNSYYTPLPDWEGYDPTVVNEQNLQKVQDTFGKAINTYYTSQFGERLAPAVGQIALDLHNIRYQLNNQKMQGTLSEIETGKLQRKQFEQMRKIASEGNEEASADQRPTGKASVLIGSNIPDRKQKRTSHSRDAGTARAKVKVQAKGINI